jgi:hypothetical protein
LARSGAFCGMACVPAANSARPCPNLLRRPVVPCFARGRANPAPNCRRTRASSLSRAPQAANRITCEAGCRECPLRCVQDWMMVIQALNSRTPPPLGIGRRFGCADWNPGGISPPTGKRTVFDKGRAGQSGLWTGFQCAGAARGPKLTAAQSQRCWRVTKRENPRWPPRGLLATALACGPDAQTTALLQPFAARSTAWLCTQN